MTFLPAGNIAEKSCIWLRRFADLYSPNSRGFLGRHGKPRWALLFRSPILRCLASQILGQFSVSSMSDQWVRLMPSPIMAMAAIPAILASSQCLCGELVFRSPDHPMPDHPIFLRPSACVPQPETHPPIALC